MKCLNGLLVNNLCVWFCCVEGLLYMFVHRFKVIAEESIISVQVTSKEVVKARVSVR